MSKIYNVDNLSDRYKDNNFKEREIKAFEIKFPEARIIRDHYDHEGQLDEDWQKYCELPYHLKVLTNERCLRLYGCKNEQQYIRLKAEFAQKDIDRVDIDDQSYKPMGFREALEDETLIKQAKDYMNNGGHSLLLINYDNLTDLNNDWYNFNNQCYEYKVVANNKSLEIYGKTVPEVYQREIKKFLSKDIKGASLNDLGLRPVINDSLAATEAVMEEIDYTLDPIESIILLELAKKQISSPVEESIYNLKEKVMTDYIKGENSLRENYLGKYNYLLPWEILGLFESSEDLMNDKLFVNYYARALGLKPTMKNFQEEVRTKLLTEKNPNNLLLIGWNPFLNPTLESHRNTASMRSNMVLQEYCKYWFLNLEHTPNLLTESEYKQPFHKGISIVIIQELDKDNEDKIQDTPKVMVSLDYSKPTWKPLMYGKLEYEQNIDDILNQFKIPVVSNYFLRLGDQLYDRIASTNIDEFNKSNEIQRICSALHTMSPHIANSELFINYLLSSIMHSHFGNSVFPLRFDYDRPKDVIINLYSKLFGTYDDIMNSYSKLGLFREDGANIQSTFIFENSNIIVNEIYEDESLIDVTDFSMTHTFNETWSDFINLINPQPNI